jgi:hypothetical protein
MKVVDIPAKSATSSILKAMPEPVDASLFNLLIGVFGLISLICDMVCLFYGALYVQKLISVIS